MLRSKASPFGGRSVSTSAKVYKLCVYLYHTDKMKRLVFKLSYAENILKGEKRSTIRLRSSYRVGEIVEIYVGSARVGRAIIKHIERKRLSEISDEDARIDGFKDRTELLKELMRIYGKKVMSKNPELYIIYFQLL